MIASCELTAPPAAFRPPALPGPVVLPAMTCGVHAWRPCALSAELLMCVHGDACHAWSCVLASMRRPGRPWEGVQSLAAPPVTQALDVSAASAADAGVRLTPRNVAALRALFVLAHKLVREGGGATGFRVRFNL